MVEYWKHHFLHYDAEVIAVPSLKNDQKEADDRMMYPLNQSIKDEGFEKVIIGSADTNISMCAVYHLTAGSIVA